MLIPDKNQEPINLNPALTPYTREIQDACDQPGVQVVAVSGPGRAGKTISAEAHAYKRWKYGPAGTMYWYMQSKDALEDYIEERGEWMLKNNDEIAEQIDWTARRNSRTRKRIGGHLNSWLAATDQSTIGKAAPFIVADEINAMSKKLRAGIKTKLLNRQREFGTAALLYVASHPDGDPGTGIISIISEGLRHLWWWRCKHCDKPSSPCVEASTRMTWNVSELLALTEGMDKDQVLDLVAERASLICPHCKAQISDKDRLEMSLRTGAWLQPQQEMMDDGAIAGERRIDKIMGFMIHAFMSPFVTVAELAREFVAAKMAFEESTDDTQLREVTSKSLGEVYEGAKAEEVVEGWQVLKARFGAGAGVYARGTVPPGVRFITAFADTHGYGWEVRVIGWGNNLESWLIDAYAIKQGGQFPGIEGREFGNLKPATKIEDWAMLEYGVIDRLFPIANRPGWYLPVAKLVVDDNGEPGVSNMGRIWLSNLKARGVTAGGKPFAGYRVQLQVGSSKVGGELYGVPKQVMKDDLNRALPVPVTILAPDVTTLKKMIARRMKVDNPAEGGRMHVPADIPDAYIKQLESERLTNGKWYRFRDNETWDGWVAAETARYWLRPELVNWNKASPDYDPPEWASPVQVTPLGIVREDAAPQPVSQWQEIAAMNAGVMGDAFDA